MNPTIVHYFTYPVKSTRGFVQAELAFDENHMLRGDRNFALIDETNKVVTARQLPQLVTLAVSVDSESITFSRREETVQLLLSSFKVNDPVSVSYFGRPKNVVLLDSEIFSDWTQQQIGQKLRIVKARPQVIGAELANFVDASTVLLVNSASFDALGMADATSSIDSFRGNIVINADAWIEKKWRFVKIGSVNFEVIEECGRCSMVGINAENGQFDSGYTKKLKTALGSEFNFGIYLKPLNSGVITQQSFISTES